MLKFLPGVIRSVLVLVLVSVFAGCTSVPMPKGSSKGYASARFVEPNKAGGIEETSLLIDANRMIKTSITSQMEQHGLNVVAGNADLIIAYLIIFQDNVSTSYSNQYYGYQDFSEIMDLAHKKGMKGHYPELVQKRALVIDLIDAKTFKLVYRDYSVGSTLANLSETERQEQINGAVAQTLQKFFK